MGVLEGPFLFCLFFGCEGGMFLLMMWNRIGWYEEVGPPPYELRAGGSQSGKM